MGVIVGEGVDETVGEGGVGIGVEETVGVGVGVGFGVAVGLDEPPELPPDDED